MGLGARHCVNGTGVGTVKTWSTLASAVRADLEGALIGAQVASRTCIRELNLHREKCNKEDLLAQEAVLVVPFSAGICLPVAWLHIERFPAVFRRPIG